MLINDLDYLKIVGKTVRVAGGAVTITHAFTVAELGIALADSGAIAIGDQTATITVSSAVASYTKSSFGYLTKTVDESAATAISSALALDYINSKDTAFRSSTSISRSESSHKSYLVSN